MRRNRRKRSGAVMIEFAIIAPILFLMLIGIVVAGLGIFRYQQVAHLARESSRWASVRGKQYQKETGQTAATAEGIYNNVIAAKEVGLDLTKLQYTVIWNTNNNPHHTVIVDGRVEAITNTVSVAISYHWVPEAYFGGATIRSTSVTPMSY